MRFGGLAVVQSAKICIQVYSTVESKNRYQKEYALVFSWLRLNETHREETPDRKRGYCGLFSLTFINPSFRYLPIVNIENLDFKNPRFSNIRLFDIHL